MKLLVLYGPPGVGKHTVGKELSRLTGYKFFHNHYIVDLVSALFPWGTPDYFELSKEISDRVFQKAISRNINFVTTYVYAAGLDDQIIKQRIKSVEKTGGDIHFVLLSCSQKTLERRVRSKGRKKYKKLNTAKSLRELMKKYKLTTAMNFVKTLEIDTTNKSPKTTARLIKEYYKL